MIQDLYIRIRHLCVEDRHPLAKDADVARDGLNEAEVGEGSIVAALFSDLGAGAIFSAPISLSESKVSVVLVLRMAHSTPYFFSRYMPSKLDINSECGVLSG